MLAALFVVAFVASFPADPVKYKVATTSFLNLISVCSEGTVRYIDSGSLNYLPHNQ